MENIDDFVPGTAYVRIPESVFNDKQYFKNLLKFLRLPDHCTVIEIDVTPDSYLLNEFGVLRKVSEKVTREEINNVSSNL